MDQTDDKLKGEQGKRKAVINELEDLKGKIRVYCRVRPLSKSEQEEEDRAKMCVDIVDQMTVQVQGKFDQSSYNFNSVFGPQTSQ